MKFYLFIFILFTSSLIANTIDINKSFSKEILSSSQILIDNSKTLTIKEILNNQTDFSDINSSVKRFGYSPNFNVWIKFTLHNSQNEPISKILEFDNSLVTNIALYENELLINKEGLLDKKIDRKQLEIKAKELLDLVELGHRVSHKPLELSGGEKQRVAIARALVNEPNIILADEPTGNLDLETSETISKLFKKINEEKKQTIVIVTHSNELAELTKDKYKIEKGNLKKI